MIDTRPIRMRWEADGSKRDERGQRLFAASEARAAGWGGVATVAKITGVSRKRIIAGLKDLAAPPLDPGRVRRKGGGRRPITETDGTIVEDLKHLVEPVTMGDPMRPLMWVSKSQEKLADELVALGHDVSPNTVGRLLVDELAYSRQVNRKTHEGSSHPDRNAQFEHINAQVKAAQAAGQPVISVDTKKKELIGNFRNSGSDYRPKGCPIDVNMHDFSQIGHRLGRTALAEVATVAKPDTILAWYRKLIAHKFDGSKARRGPGRPRVARKVEQLIVRLAEENRDWGYDRIAGALANLGYRVCDQTVGNVLQRHGLPPAPEHAYDHLVGVHSHPLGAAGGHRLLHRGGAHSTRARDLLRAVFHPSREPPGRHRRDHHSSQRAMVEANRTKRDHGQIRHPTGLPLSPA
jgi:hypothetical protein